MTNRLALILGLLILIALAIDFALVGDAHVIFLAKKFMELLNWVAFWR